MSPHPNPADRPHDLADRDATAVAAGPGDPRTLRALTSVALDALADGAAARGGPLPHGGPDEVAARTRALISPVLPEEGVGAQDALYDVVRAAAQGAADPSDPRCAAHLHCPPLAMAAAADLAASALNPSMDSWDQAPAAAVIEEAVTAELARVVYPEAEAADAIVTSGGTESNLVALLLARERAQARGERTVQVLVGENAHHSVRRAAWILGLPTPITVDCRAGRMLPAALDRALASLGGAPALVVATAGTTDEGLIDPLPQLAEVAAGFGAELHVDAAYGGPLLFSRDLAPLLHGIEQAVSVTYDLHKLGWQPVAAGVLAVRDRTSLGALSLRADYLNADDDTEAGLPDLLGRSIRTSRRPDVLKIATTLRALGREGVGGLVEHCVDTARRFAESVDRHPALRRRDGDAGISTVLFRPLAADALVDEAGDEAGDALVAAIRRELLAEGRAVLGRAVAEDHDGVRRLWLKATLLHPRATADDLRPLLELVAERARSLAEPQPATAGDAVAATLPGQQGAGLETVSV
ncbi:pyridoxal phosphate-dependent decarboxylase family protein [Streptomyces alkaliterrae]|uniref:Aminotransferase class V-fold PLP-dependent enzyme n=1 Tax=Streptomyces alkaliterrae TaxID=2213162 RepID=A0A5P0YTK2_9ACTN|nr:aspartate aminotransferase family protein [Streptomyces alkaliterrae]MBB1261068.1 aspartate aminotransferase family protein [Streptomyces alkaliterrae]MQS03250.1 aminotransferase class V-fold PLP-dependent enzyme [Streptomyces alkaliterrae]